MTAQTTTPMKRAGQLIAHLGVLHQISDVRQLLLLQLVMRDRQDQAALFRRSEQDVTLNLIGVQAPLNSTMLTHRAGTVSAVVLLDQLQALSGIQGNDVAFSSGQINDLITTRTQAIEQSDELARLDAALSVMINRAHQEASLQSAPPEPVAAQRQPLTQQVEPLPEEPERDGSDYTPDDLNLEEVFHSPDGEEASVLQQEDLANNNSAHEELENLSQQVAEEQVVGEDWSAVAEPLSEPDAAEEPQAVPASAPRRGRRPA